MARAKRVAGGVMLAVGFLLFMSMPFMIIAYGYPFIMIIPVAMILISIGVVLMSSTDHIVQKPSFTRTEPVEPSEPPGETFQDDVPEPYSGFGFGYCPNCGSPLSAGDMFCGVCGKRL